MQFRFKHLLCSASFGLVMTMAASAQTITGSVSGTVTDPSGAVIAGAKIAATNVDTGVTVTETSNSAGVYSIRFLQIGRYKVVTTAKGFTTQSFGPFSLEIDQTAKVDAKLSVGGDASKVDVSTEQAPLLDTTDSTSSTTITASSIENLPLSGRNWSTLTLLVPGATASNPSSFGGSGNGNAIERNTNGGGNSQASINGNRAEGNNYRLDGIEINETVNNLVGYNPNPDALAEVKVISSNAPAEYGNVNGGDVVAVTKSGTNHYHGSASAYLQNYLLDANTWTNKDHAAGQQVARNPYTQTQYSATFGGPIIKDKLFAFADYFGTRYHKGGNSTSSVLSALMRTGDFSELLNPAIMCSSTGGDCTAPGAGKLIQLYDPNNGYAPYLDNKNVPINNTVASFLIAHPEYYPEPNLTPGADSPVLNNYTGPSNSRIKNDQFDVKVDYTPTSKDRISARYLQGKANDYTTSALAITFPGQNVYPDKGIAINYVRTISPAIVNEFRAGYTRVRWQQGEPLDTTGGFGLKGNSLVGIPGTQAFEGFSAMTVTGITTVGNPAGGSELIDNTFLYGDDLTWQRGKHLLKAGAEFLRYQQNNFYAGNDGALGGFRYGNNNSATTLYTSNPNVSASATTVATGYAPADFLLDRAAFVGIGGVAGRTGQRQWRSGYFVQDDWKLLPNLTLNLGLRYEYFQPIYEVNNKEVNVNLSNGTLEYAGSVPSTNTVAGATVCPTRACYNATYNNFMPRVGFSYQPVSRVVVRGGFGITKALEGTGANLRLTYNPPFQSSTEEYGVAPSTTNPGTSFSTANGFSTGASNYGSGFYRADDPNLKPQVTNEYSLTTEYQINNFSTFRLGYTGESSTHLIQAVAGNQLKTPCYLDGVLSTDPNSAACSAVDPAPFQALVGQGGGLFETVTEGEANYNGLQASYRQRTNKGLEYTVNYSYARAMTNAVGFFGVAGINGPSPYAQNAYDNAAEYGPAGGDVRHAVSGNMVYAIPFGRGKQFGSGVNAFVDEALGGWKVAMTGVVYSGAPVTITGADFAYTNNKTSRPNQISNVKLNQHKVNNWFGDATTKYAPAAPGTYGNARVGSERAPGFQQYDMSIFKDFGIYHENKLGFRADALNLFNITSLGAPNNDSTSTTFGQITSVRSNPRQLTLSLKYQF